jgi:subtilase family serine protease
VVVVNLAKSIPRVRLTLGKGLARIQQERTEVTENRQRTTSIPVTSVSSCSNFSGDALSPSLNEINQHHQRAADRAGEK